MSDPNKLQFIIKKPDLPPTLKFKDLGPGTYFQFLTNSEDMFMVTTNQPNRGAGFINVHSGFYYNAETAAAHAFRDVLILKNPVLSGVIDK